MWTSSISRIALSTSLAVAGGLSLVGVLVSLPDLSRSPAQSAAALSGPAAGPTSPQADPAATVQQSLELAGAIDRVEAVLSDKPAATLATAAEQTEPAPEPESWSGTLQPDELAAIAPAAGRRAPGTSGATTSEPQEIARKPAADPETGAEPTAVPGAYVASTIHAGTQTAASQAVDGQALDGQKLEGQTARTQPVTGKTTAPAAEQPETQAGGMDGLAPAAAGGPAGYVIIGSFRHNGNAARHVGDHRTWLPQILTKQVDGKLQYRVAIGPFSKADLSAARERIIASGIADAWLLPHGKDLAATPLQSLDILG